MQGLQVHMRKGQPDTEAGWMQAAVGAILLSIASLLGSAEHQLGSTAGSLPFYNTLSPSQSDMKVLQHSRSCEPVCRQRLRPSQVLVHCRALVLVQLSVLSKSMPLQFSLSKMCVGFLLN